MAPRLVSAYAFRCHFAWPTYLLLSPQTGSLEQFGHLGCKGGGRKANSTEAGYIRFRLKITSGERVRLKSGWLYRMPVRERGVEALALPIILNESEKHLERSTKQNTVNSFGLSIVLKVIGRECGKLDAEPVAGLLP